MSLKQIIIGLIFVSHVLICKNASADNQCIQIPKTENAIKAAMGKEGLFYFEYYVYAPNSRGKNLKLIVEKDAEYVQVGEEKLAIFKYIANTLSNISGVVSYVDEPFDATVLLDFIKSTNVSIRNNMLSELANLAENSKSFKKPFKLESERFIIVSNLISISGIPIGTTLVYEKEETGLTLLGVFDLR